MTDRTLALVPLATATVVLVPVAVVGVPSTSAEAVAVALPTALSLLLVGAYFVARRVDPEAGDPELLEGRIARSRGKSDEEYDPWNR